MDLTASYEEVSRGTHFTSLLVPEILRFKNISLNVAINEDCRTGEFIFQFNIIKALKGSRWFVRGCPFNAEH